MIGGSVGLRGRVREESLGVGGEVLTAVGGIEAFGEDYQVRPGL